MILKSSTICIGIITYAYFFNNEAKCAFVTIFNKKNLCVRHGCASITPPLRRLRLENFEFEANLGYTVSPYLKHTHSGWGRETNNNKTFLGDGE
jgi:hypothetical protein